MTIDNYSQQLDCAFKNEIYGEAIFTVMARFSISKEYRNKWLKLARLEALTQAKLAPITSPAGIFSHKANAYKGYIVGAIALFLPKRFFIKVLLRETERYIPMFKQLELLGPVTDRPILLYLTAHEQALADFSKMELFGSHQESLTPILLILALHKLPAME